MKVQKPNEITILLYLVTVQILINSVICNLSYENKEYVRIQQDPARFHQASALLNKRNVFTSRHFNVSIPRSITTKPILNNQTASKPNLKKWQVGRVSRKQYEIINMLWRKTKMFINLDQTTSGYQNPKRRENDTKKVVENILAPRQSFPRYVSRPNTISTTTPSYIEFYYLDETDERGKESTSTKFAAPKKIRESQLRNLGNFKFVLDSPMFAFRIDDPNYKRSALSTRYTHPTNRMKRRKTRTHDSSLTGFESLNSITPPFKFPRKRAKTTKSKTVATRPTTSPRTPSPTAAAVNITQYKLSLNTTKNSSRTLTTVTSTSEYTIENETCPYTTDIAANNDTSEIISEYTMNSTHITESTTVYDKIKFFEMYDRHTPIPYYDEKGNLIDIEDVEIFVKGNDLNERKVLLEHIDQSIENKHTNILKAKHSKKHIIDNFNSESKSQNFQNAVGNKDVIKPIALNMSMNNVTKRPIMKTSSTSEAPNLLQYRESKYAKWSQYPFVAAYVYEPSQVHCDAAGISPHWLITSASCLSRHHKNPGGEGRSAFVTYCGDSWWNPERVAYVKYSLVHPRYHPRDKTRRHLYNIGLIQVVSSMASACNGWSSITIMSHQFIADAEGSTANAIGWGLDRFDTRYSSSDLPRSPLTSYESEVYSDSCPGNVGYSKAKSLDEEGGVKNVYCLSLPPYLSEEKDPVHGGLLLVGGKLVALYLQEERRPWGNQCAQYTGTWRLVPWVLDMARESEETDAFTLDI